MTSNRFVVVEACNLKDADCGQQAVQGIATGVGQHDFSLRGRDQNHLFHSREDRFSDRDFLRRRRFATGLFVHSVRQSESLERRRRTRFDDHPLDRRSGIAEFFELKRQHGGVRRSVDVTQDIAHAVKGLIDDSVVITVEWRLRFSIGDPADVHRVAGLAGTIDEEMSVFLGVAIKPADRLKLPNPVAQFQFDRQSERKIESPKCRLRLIDLIDKKRVDVGTIVAGC